jgi:ABC-type transporter Mla maintaining outer membrane lipid asymmetry ATPase subunit MlaF
MSTAKNMLRRLHEEYGATFVLISHQVASIADMVNEYHFFDQGRHILSCDLAGLKQSSHEKIKYYMQLQSLR